MPADVAHPLQQGHIASHEARDAVVHDVLQGAQTLCLVHRVAVVQVADERLDSPLRVVSPSGYVEALHQRVGDGLVLGRRSKHT